LLYQSNVFGCLQGPVLTSAHCGLASVQVIDTFRSLKLREDQLDSSVNPINSQKSVKKGKQHVTKKEKKACFLMLLLMLFLFTFFFLYPKPYKVAAVYRRIHT
jgi:hypothetical protein